MPATGAAFIARFPISSAARRPQIDLVTLEAELRTFLHEIVHGDFMQTHVTPEARRINDIALSGNGEPTSAREFEQVIELIGRVKADYDLPKDLKLVLITNGSLIDRPGVQAGLSAMAELNGEVWFKLDSVTREGRQRINNTRMSLMRMRENLRLATHIMSYLAANLRVPDRWHGTACCGIGCVSELSGGAF